MEIINDIESSKQELANCIKKYGSVREHNYWYFYNQLTNSAKGVFFKFNGNCGILSIRSKSGVWEIIGNVLAPEQKKLEFFEHFLDYALLIKKDKKVFVSVTANFYKAILSTMGNSPKYRTTTPKIYFNPIYNLKKWDESLSGRRWKKVRNIKNRFFKSYDVEILPSLEVDKKKLIEIVMRWRKYRPKRDKIFYPKMYNNFINNNFVGSDIARTIVVNGEPSSITAGWSISNSNNYYSAIGLHNYKFKGLGEVANIDDLEQIKKAKYEYADFGDSDGSLLQFKKKFWPSSFYQTYWFHIVKR